MSSQTASSESALRKITDMIQKFSDTYTYGFFDIHRDFVNEVKNLKDKIEFLIEENVPLRVELTELRNLIAFLPKVLMIAKKLLQ